MLAMSEQGGMRLALSSNRHQCFGLLKAFLLIGGRGALRPDPPLVAGFVPPGPGGVLLCSFRFFFSNWGRAGFWPDIARVMWVPIWLKRYLVEVRAQVRISIGCDSETKLRD